MKLDTKAIRYLSSEDWRVLAAVEQGSKNHEVVPTPLISSIAGLRGGSGVHKNISNLAKVGLIGKVKNARYDGYRLTYGGLDYLALNAHRKSDTIFSLGNQIGVGKESDIYITANADGRQQVLKLHRLGRISFRTVKANRDYLRNRQTGSWMYLSRLAAQKEHAFMRVLYREGFSVPEPIAWSRHTVVMEFIDSFPLRMVDSVPDPGKLYAELMQIIVDLAKRGLIHGDFNEFNILIKEREEGGKVTLKPVLIDFPQTVSTNHANAEYYFDRDVACVKRYFERRFKYVSDEDGPFFADAMKGADQERRLDIEVEASGFSKKMGKELERFVEATASGVGETEQDEGAQDEELDDDDGGDQDDEAHQVDGEQDGGSDVESNGQIDDPALAEDLGGLSVEDDVAAKQYVPADFRLEPLELSHDPDVVAEKVRSKKKATGWAI
ncbi:Serine/threonine-protein kinase rio2 [Fulvia fulva]|uniref:Serine/threonine-protein kinase RIO2 n=1 Tax=Passalora fulva TaxID=5499 RepID=A0A9Q8PF15_PASFU|nr:Serine/threonine-protein kinase rio2 [Fulvia fulva]KAK4617825.1 Serine/threonine-protein kinase rio2 [Fulvia fulva]KAK4618790.1 Serine/threonine-protein kinase rio2 [Fulvia fulva]UJO21404.1 Serine/threonine-protein kinase rio2 [Fulvia fulva]WPV18174.1 Serine/threonine-protein kinase rio2 [Fulvia fulva]WPV33644.1 Serine/threonine-protein kinase rio2 [Fulvia fulva]